MDDGVVCSNTIPYLFPINRVRFEEALCMLNQPLSMSEKILSIGTPLGRGGVFRVQWGLGHSKPSSLRISWNQGVGWKTEN